MKYVLLLLLLSPSFLMYGQDNLIQDGTFEQATFSENKMVRKKAPKGEWYPYLTSDRQASLSVQSDKEKGKVVVIQTLGQPSYAYSYVGQTIESIPDADVYELSFEAKALTEQATYLGVYLKINSGEGSLYFPVNDYDPKEHPTVSGALKQIRVSPEWIRYTVEFDLSKTINTVSNAEHAKSLIISRAIKADRKDFDVAIACITKNAGLLFTQVRLMKKK